MSDKPKPLTCDDYVDADVCPACQQAQDFSFKIAMKIVEMCAKENMSAPQSAQSALYAALTLTEKIAVDPKVAVGFVTDITNGWIDEMEYSILQNSELKKSENKSSVANTITGNGTKH